MSSIIPAHIDLVGLSSRLDRSVQSGMDNKSWEELTRIFTRHDIRSQKDGPCFMPARMKPRDEWILSTPRPGTKAKPGYRNDTNIAAVTMVVLDLDKEGACEKAERAFNDMEYVLYTTHSHTQNSPHKIRLIMPVLKPIPADDWSLVFSELAHQVSADIACSNVSRIFYYPSASPDAGIPPMSRHHRGNILDAEALIEKIKAAAVEATPTLNKDNAAPGAIRPRREAAPHFAGDDYLPNPANYRLFALERRHRASITQLLQDDSRHHFAMTVVAREIARFGPRTDMAMLMQFVFYAGQNNSSRGISTGNTLNELPELIMSAWNKFGAHQQEMRYASIGSAITDAIAGAMEAQQTGRWGFTDQPGLPPATLMVDVPTNNPITYASELIEAALAKHGPTVKLADLARHCIDNLKHTDSSELAITLTMAADAIRPKNGPWTEEQFQRFWRGALARAVVSVHDNPGFAP